MAWLKRPKDVASLADLQAKLLDRAAGWVKPGGMLVYSTCSLEPEEGEDRVAAFLAAHPEFTASPVRPEELPGLEEAISPEGWLRTLPSHWPNDEARLGGLDGFFAARLLKTV